MREGKRGNHEEKGARVQDKKTGETPGRHVHTEPQKTAGPTRDKMRGFKQGEASVVEGGEKVEGNGFWISAT